MPRCIFGGRSARATSYVGIDRRRAIIGWRSRRNFSPTIENPVDRPEWEAYYEIKLANRISVDLSPTTSAALRYLINLHNCINELRDVDDYRRGAWMISV